MFTVYLADRDVAHRKELAHACRRRGLRTVEFTSGSDLYASVIAGAPDLVLLDVDLDEMDGFQVFSRLLRRRAERPLPLVFLSDFVHAHVVEVCLQRGARAYLRKGDPAERVATAISDLLTTPDASAAPGLVGGNREPDGDSARVDPAVAKGRRRSRLAILAACALVAALGFAIGAVLAARFPGPSSPAVREHARTSTRGVPAPGSTRSVAPRALGAVWSPEQPAPENARPTPPDSLTLPAVQSRTAARAASTSPVREVRTDPASLGPAPVHRSTLPAPDPGAEILHGLGLPLPGGAALDVGGSDVRPASERGHPGEARAPRVLTFRVGQTLEEVLELYAREGVEFDRRVVRMQAPFPGVERTVARGRLALEDGREATLTVSRPGIDFAAQGLFPETSLRIDIPE